MTVVLLQNALICIRHSLAGERSKPIEFINEYKCEKIQKMIESLEDLIEEISKNDRIEYKEHKMEIYDSQK